MIDAEDRKVLAQAAIFVVAVILTLIIFAAAAGIAWSVFRTAGGL